MQLNIMTYNIASGRYYRNDADFTPDGLQVVDLSKCADVIREIAPDFCGINEINCYHAEYLEKLPFLDKIASPTATLSDENTEITVSEDTIFLCRM